MRCNLLYVFDNMEFGGGERIFAQIINRLSGKKYKIMVACLPTGAFIEKIKGSGAEIKSVDILNDEIKKDITYMFINEFNSQFLKKFSSTNCNELLGVDISTPEGIETISKKKLHEQICPAIIKYSAEIIEEIITKSIKK